MKRFVCIYLLIWLLIYIKFILLTERIFISYYLIFKSNLQSYQLTRYIFFRGAEHPSSHFARII